MVLSVCLRYSSLLSRERRLVCTSSALLLVLSDGLAHSHTTSRSSTKSLGLCCDLYDDLSVLMYHAHGDNRVACKDQCLVASGNAWQALTVAYLIWLEDTYAFVLVIDLAHNHVVTAIDLFVVELKIVVAKHVP